MNKQPGVDPSLSNQLIEMEAEVSNMEDKAKELERRSNALDEAIDRIDSTLTELLSMLEIAMRNDPNVRFQNVFIDRMIALTKRWEGRKWKLQ